MQNNTTLPIWVRTKDGVSFGDVPVHSGGRMPDFCIIGAAKSGTTGLNAMLAAQSFIYMNPLKEPHFFSTPAILEKGDDWYRGLYAKAASTQFLGEASTSYTRHPAVEGTAARLAAANPDMKLIYVLRNPLARVESECLQTLKYASSVLDEDHTYLSLDDFFHQIEQPDHSYYSAIVSTSTYIDQIEHFRQHFSADNMLIVLQEDLKRDPKQVLTNICALLGADPALLVDTYIRANVTSDWQAGVARTRKAAKFQKLPFYSILKAVVPSQLKSYLLRHTKEETNLRFSDGLREELTERFREPNRRLAKILGALPADWPQ
jgi:hypothetical protein